MKLGSRSQLSNFIHLEIQLYTSHYFVAENSCTRRMNKQCPIEHLPRCLLAETRDVTENCALKYHLLPRAHAQGLSVCLSVVCKKKLSNILQVDTSSTYNRKVHAQLSPFYHLSTLDVMHVMYQALRAFCATGNGAGLGTS